MMRAVKTRCPLREDASMGGLNTHTATNGRTQRESEGRRNVELERLNPQQFEKFSDFIYKQTGIRIDRRKTVLLSNRIRRRLQAGTFDNFDDYYRFLTSAAGSNELEGFLDAITTNETFFFRTEKQFVWLKEQFIPSLVTAHRAGQRTASLRILSAGCATGAEPYSIAICLAEDSLRLRGWDLQVVGLDISEEALQSAHRGVYPSRALQAVTPSQRRRYFRLRDADNWHVQSQIKQLVEFRQHNLMTALEAETFDCVFLCNVLIYFDRDSKRVVIDNLIRSLVGGGYLVVGPSEGVFDMLGALDRVAPLLYRKRDSGCEEH